MPFCGRQTAGFNVDNSWKVKKNHKIRSKLLFLVHTLGMGSHVHFNSVNEAATGLRNFFEDLVFRMRKMISCQDCDRNSCFPVQVQPLRNQDQELNQLNVTPVRKTRNANRIFRKHLPSRSLADSQKGLRGGRPLD